MRALITSTLALVILISSWGLFFNYSEKTLNDIIQECEETVMPAMEDGEWKTAYDSFRTLNHKWHKYRKSALFFLDTQDVSEADSNFAKTLMYIKAKDLSNSSGELLALREQLKFLHENEGIYLRNIL